MLDGIKLALRILALIVIAFVASRIENHTDPERLNGNFLFILWFIAGILLLIYGELITRKR